MDSVRSDPHRCKHQVRYVTRIEEGIKGPPQLQADDVTL